MVAILVVAHILKHSQVLTLVYDHKHICLTLQQHRHKKGQVETVTLNPKCVTMGELYGETGKSGMTLILCSR